MPDGYQTGDGAQLSEIQTILDMASGGNSEAWTRASTLIAGRPKSSAGGLAAGLSRADADRLSAEIAARLQAGVPA